jgi:predicted nuclease of predicted toxin-antitoxin system
LHGSIHVGSIHLDRTPDVVIWKYAKQHGFSFLMKDKDSGSLSITWGAPSKVVLLQIGNCSTAEIERIVRNNAIRFSDFDEHAGRSLLILAVR